MERGTMAELLVGEAVVAARPLEARIAWRLTRLHATEEGLEGSIEPRQYVLQHLGVDVVVFGPHLFDRRQLGALACGGDAHAAFVPGIAPLLQGGVVEFPAAAQDKR